MSLLIDGYNLLHVTGIFGKDRGAASFRQSREALLDFLSAALDPQELSRTIVVFDASEAPPGLPRTLKYAGLTVQFAADYESADELLEELIRADSAPGKLIVVSSDHRVQRAAKRRKAEAIDSHRWYAERVRAFQEREEQGSVHEAKPEGPLSAIETKWWLAQFPALNPEDHSRAEDDRRSLRPPEQTSARPPSTTSDSGPSIRRDPAEKSKPVGRSIRDEKPSVGELANPFPPSYVDEVNREANES